MFSNIQLCLPPGVVEKMDPPGVVLQSLGSWFALSITTLRVGISRPIPRCCKDSFRDIIVYQFQREAHTLVFGKFAFYLHQPSARLLLSAFLLAHKVTWPQLLFLESRSRISWFRHMFFNNLLNKFIYYNPHIGCIKKNTQIGDKEHALEKIRL